MGCVFRKPGRLSWMIKYYRDGKAIYEGAGTEIKDEARDLLKVREAAIAKGAPVTKADRLKFDDAVKDVENDYKVNGKKSGDGVEYRVRLHLAPVFGGRRMSTITTADVRKYIAARLDAGAKRATVNNELAILNRAFTLAIVAGLLLAKPKIEKMDPRNVRTGFFEREQFDAVVRHLPAELIPVMTFAYLTGWRIKSEILPITWAQVDERAEVIRLEVGSTKNTEGRTLPYGLLPELRDVIEAQAKRREALKKAGTISPYVFGRDDGTAINPWFFEAWRAACKAAGCPGRIPHDFRRTAVRNMERAGVSRSVAMKITGHKTESVYRRYAITNEGDIREGLGKLAALPTAPVARRGRRR